MRGAIYARDFAVVDGRSAYSHRVALPDFLSR
jgi:hypothetical protein